MADPLLEALGLYDDEGENGDDDLSALEAEASKRARDRAGMGMAVVPRGDRGEEASAETLDVSLRFVNRALQNFGIPNAPIRIGYGDETETSIEDAIKAVSVVTALITQRQRDLEKIDEHDDIQHELENEIRELRERLAKSREQTKSKTRELNIANLSIEQLKGEMREKDRAHRQEKERIRKECSDLRQRDTHHRHKIKTTEREFERLKGRLTKALADKDMEMKASLQQLSRLRNQHKSSAAAKGRSSAEAEEGEFARTVVNIYTQKVNELEMENSDLRSTLKTYERQLRLLLHHSPHDLNESMEGNVSLLDISLASDVFELPYEMAKSSVEDSIRLKLRQIRARMAELAETGREHSVEESVVEKDGYDSVDAQYAQRVEVLEKQLEECRRLMGEQEELIQYSISQQSRLDASFDADESVAEEDSRMFSRLSGVEEREKLLSERERTFDRERQQYTQKAIALEQEKEALKQEKEKMQKEMEELRQCIGRSNDNEKQNTPKDQYIRNDKNNIDNIHDNSNDNDDHDSDVDLTAEEMDSSVAEERSEILNKMDNLYSPIATKARQK